LKIPKKIKIKGIEYTVKFKDLGDKIFGEYIEMPAQIIINTKASKEFQEMTLLHEILHIIRGDMKEQWARELAWDLWLILNDNNLLR